MATSDSVWIRNVVRPNDDCLTSPRRQPMPMTKFGSGSGADGSNFPASSQRVARIQPMVPDLSLFIPSSGKVDNRKVVAEEELKSKPKPTSRPETSMQNEDINVVEMLRQQSDQINQLQDQLRQLISAANRPCRPADNVDVKVVSDGAQVQTAIQVGESATSPPIPVGVSVLDQIRRAALRSIRSTPSEDEDGDEVRIGRQISPVSTVRNERERSSKDVDDCYTDVDDDAVIIVDDVGDSRNNFRTFGECNRSILKKAKWKSTTNNWNNIHEESNLGDVEPQRQSGHRVGFRCVTPTTSSSTSTAVKSERRLSAERLADRLRRQCGVSFIDADQLLQQSSSEARQPRSPPSLPPSTAVINEKSIDFHSTAIQHLDDRYLANMIGQRREDIHPTLCSTTSNDRNFDEDYGLRSTELSVATKEFLNRNRLTRTRSSNDADQIMSCPNDNMRFTLATESGQPDPPPPPPTMLLGDVSKMLNQPKLV